MQKMKVYKVTKSAVFACGLSGRTSLGSLSPTFTFPSVYPFSFYSLKTHFSILLLSALALLSLQFYCRFHSLTTPTHLPLPLSCRSRSPLAAPLTCHSHSLVDPTLLPLPLFCRSRSLAAPTLLPLPPSCHSRSLISLSFLKSTKSKNTS